MRDLEAVVMTEEDPWESVRSETREQVYDLESVEGECLQDHYLSPIVLQVRSTRLGTPTLFI